jgi:putative ABC transport system substrate-binding protein
MPGGYGSEWVAAFVQRLHELGWIEGHTIAIEYRWAEGRDKRFAEIADEFVRLNVDVIVTAGTAPTIAAIRATSVIPIVFATAGNPIDAGIVTSLARPGGNVTGLSNQSFDIGPKRIEILSEAVPGLHPLAILANTESPLLVLHMGEVQAAARKLGLEVVAFEIRRAEDIAPVFATLTGQTEALYVVHEPLVATHMVRVNTLALGARLPTMQFGRVWKREACCPMGQTSLTITGVPPTMSIRFCAVRNRVTCRSNNQPSSTSSST